MRSRDVAMIVSLVACGPNERVTTPAPCPVASAVVPHEDVFRALVIADVASWSDPRRLLVDIHGTHATIVTSAPPGVRVLEGTIIDGKLDVTEHTSRPNVLSIVATRHGDDFEGEWREGRDRHAFKTRTPTPFVVHEENHTLSGWLGDGRIRVRLRTAKDKVDGAVLHLGHGEAALTGKLDALGQIELEEPRGDQNAVTWKGAFLDPNALAGFRSSGELFTLSFASSYPSAIALWDKVALAPEVYHSESSRECWSDTTLFHITGPADARSLDDELARFIGIRRLATGYCFGGDERWATVSWQKPPFAQIELNANGVEHGTSRCAIIDTERGHLVKLFDLVKDHAALDRFASAASKSVRCYSENEDDLKHGCPDIHVTPAATLCIEGDHVTVEDDSLPQTTIPKSEIARIFDVRSPIARGLFR
jgi:hypothetical protein